MRDNRISTLRPGLLVAVATTVTGNAKYERFDIENEHQLEDGSERAIWETKRTIANPDEYKRATDTRAKARNIIAAVCAQSQHGLLCPLSRKDELFAKLDEARALAEEFNAGAELTNISINVLVGEVKQDDVEAVKSINAEVRGLMSLMESGLKRLDVAQVRDAADRARKLGSMLSDDAQARVKGAIDVARKAAREIVKAGEVGALAVDEAVLARVRMARTAFLDMEEPTDTTEIAAPEHAGRALDFDPDAETDAPAIPVARPQVAFEF